MTVRDSLLLVQGTNGGAWVDVYGVDSDDMLDDLLESPAWDARLFRRYRVVRRMMEPDGAGNVPAWAYAPSCGAVIVGVYAPSGASLKPAAVIAGGPAVERRVWRQCGAQTPGSPGGKGAA